MGKFESAWLVSTRINILFLTVFNFRSASFLVRCFTVPSKILLILSLGGYFVKMQTAPKCKISIILDILAGAFRFRSTISNRLTQQIETRCQTPWLSSSTGAEFDSLKKIKTTGDENWTWGIGRSEAEGWGIGHW
jgi:hypothetical protein